MWIVFPICGRIRKNNPEVPKFVFEINQLVVYPSQGVGKVEAIESQEVCGVLNNFYVVRILSNDGTLMIPVNNANNVGLRSICNPDYGQTVLQSMYDWSDFKGYAGQNWNRRYREYSEKLKSGDLASVAYVLKELILISQDKELSFGERRLLEQAMGLITMELSFALERGQDEIQDEIESIFSGILKKKIQS
jgi:CarD family transcriptional regulator